ncbi:MAG TPA: hypothetical protein DDX14_10225 [Cyanobacteria bacterium UBA9579]|nr:hypothetical protein [Cyanobacteria bacterium UBA9579]
MLGELPESSSLFFSGGIDSTLIALRLSELKRTDVNMVNYVSGPNDISDYLASQVAKHLNLPINKVYFNPNDIPDILNNIIRDYSYPFVDASTFIGNDLARLTLKKLGNTPVILDGSGADCIFVGDMPIYLKFDKLYKVPLVAQKAISEAYKTFDMWKSYTPLIKPFRAFRRTALMPIQSLELGCIFDGITYNIPDQILNNLKGMYTDNISALFEGYEENTKRLNDYKFTSVLNVIKASSSGSSAKSYDFLRRNGVKLVCPFFDPKVLRLNYSIPWDQKTSEEPKALLKKMLVPQIPQELINFPKQAFLPIHEILDNEVMRDYIDTLVFNQNGPLCEFFDIKTVRRIFNHRHKHMDADFFTHLWIIIFTSIWIEQLKTSFSSKYQSAIK